MTVDDALEKLLGLGFFRKIKAKKNRQVVELASIHIRDDKARN
jgi:hypothetical protein